MSVIWVCLNMSVGEILQRAQVFVFLAFVSGSLQSFFLECRNPFDVYPPGKAPRMGGIACLCRVWPRLKRSEICPWLLLTPYSTWKYPGKTLARRWYTRLFHLYRDPIKSGYASFETRNFKDEVRVSHEELLFYLSSVLLERGSLFLDLRCTLLALRKAQGGRSSNGARSRINHVCSLYLKLFRRLKQNLKTPLIFSPVLSR